MRVPRALGQRSAWASLISANLACTSSQDLLHEPAPLEQPDGVVDVVRQKAGARPLVPILLALGAFEPGLEQGVDRHVRVSVGSDGANLDACRALVAEGDAHRKNRCLANVD